MPHRIIGLWLGFAGLLIVGILVLFGRDLRRAANRGAAWKRKLVTAGLTLLATLSFGPACKDAPDKHLSLKSKLRTRGRKDWQTIIEAYKQALPFLTLRPHSPILRPAQKQRILSDLDKALSLTTALNYQGRITDGEKSLLMAELRMLKTRVTQYPVNTMSGTCYLRSFAGTKTINTAPSLKRLHMRLTGLEKVARQDNIDPKVLHLIQKRIDVDISVLRRAAAARQLSAGDLRFYDKIEQLWTRILKANPTKTSK